MYLWQIQATILKTVMKYSYLKLLPILFCSVFLLTGCESSNDIKPKNEETEIEEEYSLIGGWLMEGTTRYGLDFKNNGVVLWRHKPYMPSELKYVHKGNTLTVSEKKGTVTFSDDGDTIVLKGFSDISSFGAEGSVGPYINGTYMRQ